MKNLINWLTSSPISIICFVLVIVLSVSCNKDDEEMTPSIIVASFDSEVSDSNYLTYNFINSSLIDGSNDGAFTSSWDFGGDGTSTEKNPSHTFSAAGTYEIRLTVTASDGDGATASKTITIELTISTINAGFIAIEELDQELTFSFTNTSVVSEISDTSFTSLWDFGGDGTSTEQSPTHTFSAVGTYEVTLTVTSSDGEVATASKTITVELTISTINAGFIAIEELDQELTFSFTNTSVVSEISDTSFTSLWDFGGDGTSTEQSPTHTFSAVGTYEVTLTVTSSDGEVATITDTIIVELSQSIPNAGFIVNQDVNQVLTFSFINTSVVTGILDASFTSLWDFGGDGTSTEQSPTHTFSAIGTYEVTLTVTAADGEENSVTETIEVNVTANQFASITDSNDDDTGELRLAVDSIQTGRLRFMFRLVEGQEMNISDAFINVAGTATTGDLSITEIRIKDNAPHEFREGASDDAIASANFPLGMPNVWVPIEISWNANGSTTPLFSVTIGGQSVITNAISTTNGGPGDVDDHLAAVLQGARNFQWKYNSNAATSDGSYHVDNIVIYSSDSGNEIVVFEDDFEERQIGENLNPSFNVNSPYHESSVDATVGGD